MTIGIFGGTFNPVHWGHIKTALEIKNTLGLEKMFLIPCGIPPHRDQPEVNADMRLAMLKLAVSEYRDLVIDERELRRSGPSYSFDTLQSLQQDYPDHSFALCVGVDAFKGFSTWHRWREIFSLAHVIVVHRPGWLLKEIMESITAELQCELEKRYTSNAADLVKQKSGWILELNVTDIAISSSTVRQRIHDNDSITGLVPENVEQYIYKHELYRG